jgi:hypothetical protein
MTLFMANYVNYRLKSELAEKLNLQLACSKSVTKMSNSEGSEIGNDLLDLLLNALGTHLFADLLLSEPF